MILIIVLIVSSSGILHLLGPLHHHTPHLIYHFDHKLQSTQQSLLSHNSLLSIIPERNQKKPPDMSQSTNVSDPGKLLSMKEVVSLLMKHNGDYCNSSINEALKTEREHCNTKLDIIVKALGDNLATAVTALSDQANALSKKIADIDMKTDVVSSYLEQQLYSLADTLRQAETSLKSLSSETRTCYICNSSYESPSEMQRHMHSQHSPEAGYLRANSNESTVAHSSVSHSQHTPCFRECNECG